MDWTPPRPLSEILDEGAEAVDRYGISVDLSLRNGMQPEERREWAEEQRALARRFGSWANDSGVMTVERATLADVAGSEGRSEEDQRRHLARCARDAWWEAECYDDEALAQRLEALLPAELRDTRADLDEAAGHARDLLQVVEHAHDRLARMMTELPSAPCHEALEAFAADAEEILEAFYGSRSRATEGMASNLCADLHKAVNQRTALDAT